MELHVYYTNMLENVTANSLEINPQHIEPAVFSLYSHYHNTSNYKPSKILSPAFYEQTCFCHYKKPLEGPSCPPRQ